MNIRLLSLLVAVGVMAGHARAQNPALPTVAQVDVKRYAGKWYEMARLPMFFENQCARNVTAEYAPDAAGRITVHNRCQKADGRFMDAYGQAAAVDPTASKLNVTFLPSALRWLPVARAPYWILMLDDDYQTVLVGEPSRRYLWILSRTPHMNESVYQAYVQKAQSLGFDVSRLVRSPHTP